MILVLILISKETEANVKGLVICSNSTEDIQRHVILICLVNTIDKKDIRIHFKKV